MAELSEGYLRSILQSNLKLWEEADTREKDGVLIKSLVLPYGIGEFTMGFQGVSNADGRRAALEAWAANIRGAVNNQVGDDSVTARAAQKAARVSPYDGLDGGPSGPEEDDKGRVEVSSEEAVPTFSSPSTLSADPSRRFNELLRARDDAANYVDKVTVELRALEAYLEVMNASKVQESPEGEDDGAKASDATV